jgi:hypothetical protein
VNVSADRTARLIFPNRMVRANQVAAGETVIVSGAPSPVNVIAAGPAGQEAIHVLCSRVSTPPWRDGIDFAELFPRLSDRRALSVIGGDEPDPVPEYGWTRRTISVVAAVE